SEVQREPGGRSRTRRACRRAVPPELRGSMDPAEIYHELLEHRWYLSERAQHEIGLDTVVEDYILNILPRARETLQPTSD
ncbi:DUF4032 domain-containing protein, partial [Streptomyces parvulus]|uniref:DUF4032 domain-containing protein n=1 Tax=Streptomyces parvulus TaxID=146923 RepID=UPI0034417A4E